jgi:hypothetical protein
MMTDNGSASGERPGALSRQQPIEWQLAAVQGMCHIGTWEFDPPRAKLVWSAETRRIMGLGKDGFDGRLETSRHARMPCVPGFPVRAAGDGGAVLSRPCFPGA